MRTAAPFLAILLQTGSVGGPKASAPGRLRETRVQQGAKPGDDARRGPSLGGVIALLGPPLPSSLKQ
jgi:hypothetical protein